MDFETVYVKNEKQFPYKDKQTYSSDDITITFAYDLYHVYHYTLYFMRNTAYLAWLHGNIWKCRDGIYCQIDGIGRKTGKTANSMEEIAHIEREWVKQYEK